MVWDDNLMSRDARGVPGVRRSSARGKSARARASGAGGVAPALALLLLALALPTFAAASEKRGIGLTTRAPHYEQIACLAEGMWYYDWSLSPTSVRYNLRFVPMARGKNDLDDLLHNPPAHPFDTLLLFNEPNKGPKAKNYNASLQATTGDLDRFTAQAAPYARTLVSPAPVRAFRPWFAEYMATPEASKDLRAVAIHWYGPADFAEFKAYIDRTAAQFKKPIWLTEFGVFDRGQTFSQQDVVRFLGQALPYLDANPMVERYAWFGLPGNNSKAYKDSGFLDEGGRLTVVGDRYLLSSMSPQERVARLSRCGVSLAAG